MQMIVELRLLLWTDGWSAGGADIDRLAVGVGGLALWRGQPACRCRPSSIVGASGRRHSSLRVHLSSTLRLSIRAYSESERRAGGGEGAAEPTLSRLAVPIKDVNERRTSLEIVYAAWHVRRCDVFVEQTAITCNLRPLILGH